MEIYTITLADGTTINNLALNGNNYISKTLIENSVFENNLDEVIIEGSDGSTRTIKNAFLVQNIKVDDAWWFILAEKAEAEVEKENMQADIEAQAQAIMELAEIIGGGM